MEIKSYKRDFEYSYTLGAFPTFELIKARPEQVMEIFVHSSFTDMEKLEVLCREKGVKLTVNDRLINRLSDKGNVFVVGVFNKWVQKLDISKPHIVLVNPSDMGNLGTIIRSAVGFGIMDMAIIEPAADSFNPKTVRASMGAIFRIRHHRYDSFEKYADDVGVNLENRAEKGEREIFTFMLNGENQLTVSNCPKPKLFSLVFGNEATGLPDEFLNYGTSIFIPQSEYVDSLNLTIAAGVGMYMFTTGLQSGCKQP